MDRAAPPSAREASKEPCHCTPRLPASTYRVQLNSGFTFEDARRLVPYLHALGVTDLYASPYLKARPGSAHGYDICDHGELNPELGTARDYDALVGELARRGMGQLMDVVPNHMSIWEAGNSKWRDVLENGPSSPYAAFFDIDWHPIRSDTNLENRVLLPILGVSYGEALENRELALRCQEGAFFIEYYERLLPVEPCSSIEILSRAVEQLEQRFEAGDQRIQELRSIITALTHLPPTTVRSPEGIAERQREKEVAKRRLKDLCEACPVARGAVDAAICLFNGCRGEPESFDLLDHLLDSQPYRLANWRVAAEEINYRRFFDINDLAAIRTEDPVVFDEIHRLVFKLLREGKVTGLRVDHPDGLRDPAGYFLKLQQRYLQELGADPPPQHVAADRPLYVVVEKILCGGESLPSGWAVHGSTGYDFANAVNGVLVDADGRSGLDATYREFIQAGCDFRELERNAKKTIMTSSLASEMNMLAYHLKRIAQGNRRYRDFTLNGLTHVLREVIACLPIYRTYTDCESCIDRRDRAYVEAAVLEAKRRNPKTPAPLFDFLGDLLLLRWPPDIREEDRREAVEFVCKLQQTTGPVMAKALEDTAFYVYSRLISLNEVGGDPGTFGISVRAFHRQNAERLRQWPHSLLATSTHDTKRSEDVRARIDVLSEIPQEWKSALRRWSKLNRKRRVEVDGRAAPDLNEKYYLYQTLLGMWPFGEVSDEEHRTLVERAHTHMQKAMREAKVNTSWMIPNLAYEEAVDSFLEAVLGDPRENPFLEDFRAFQKRVAHFGVFNSLSQLLLKIASPGVPDFYQGTELWDFSLVDPDNRRPVDYLLRERCLKELQRAARSREGLGALAREVVAAREDGRIKMHVIHRALDFRRDHPELFAEGSYVPLRAAGEKREHVLAFARRRAPETLLVVVPRLIVGLTGGKEILPLGEEVWGDSLLRLPAGDAGGVFLNLFTGESVRPVPLEREGQGVPLACVFGSFPVALLAKASGHPGAEAPSSHLRSTL